MFSPGIYIYYFSIINNGALGDYTLSLSILSLFALEIFFHVLTVT